MNDNELRELRVIVTALAQQAGLLQWVDSWAVGSNNGGLFVSLFHSRLQFRVCAVYHEQFRALPAFIRDNLPEDGDASEDIPTDRTKLEAGDARRVQRGYAPQLHPCTPFQIARYTFGEGDKAKFVFSGVVRVAQERQQLAPEEVPQPTNQPAPASKPATPLSFDTMADAIHYGCQRGVYPDYDAAREAYYALRGALQPKTPGEMFTAWVNQVEGIAATQKDFDAPKPGPPAQGQSANQSVRARIAAQPNFAG